MKKYKEWLLKEQEIDQTVPQNVVTTTPLPAVNPQAAPANNSVAQKVNYNLNKKELKKRAWKASKEEIMSFWKGISPDIPIQIHPIPYDHKGSSIQEDGIRITGTKEFIASVLSKLKQLINYENPNNKLIISYRQSPKSLIPGNKESYMFYLQVKERGKN